MKKACKLVTVLLTVFMLLSLLSGCGSKASPTDTPQESSLTEDTASTDSLEGTGLSDEPVTLSFIRAGTDGLAEAAYAELIAAYTAEHPNVTIEYQQFNFGSELETKLNTLYASGSAPDIVRAPISTIAQRASLGQYAPLDDYINSWEEKDNIIQTAYDVASYKDHCYGIAINIEASFLYYRKDHFIEAGLDPDKPPTTWEELYEYAEKLTVHEGNSVVRAGFSIPVAWGHTVFIPFARQNGATLVDVENNIPVFNDGATAEALNYLASYSANNLLIPYTINQDQNPFELGKASMMLGSLSNYKTIIASGVDWADQLMFAPLVSGRETESCFGGCQIMFMSEESKHKDWAWDFMQYLFTNESVWKLVTDAGATPVKNDLSGQFIEAYPNIGPAYLEALSYCEGMPKVKWSALFEKYLNMAYEEAMYGTKDAQTALNDAMELLESELGE